MNTKKKLALIIACSYVHANPPTIPQLPGTSNDAKQMVKFLKQYCGYASDNITVMIDDDAKIKNTDRYPTKNNIYNQIRNVLNKAQSNDEICIYYSGHGTQQAGKQSKNEEKDKLDEAIVPVDYNMITGENAIIDNTINSLLRQFGKPDTKILMIFDCCHSGTMCDLKYKYIYDKKTNSFIKNISSDSSDGLSRSVADESRKSFLNKSINSLVIEVSSCRENEASSETDNKNDDINGNNGVMTSALIYAIKSNPTSTKDIFGIIRDLDVHTSQYNQHPVISSNIDLTIDDPVHRSVFDGYQYLKNSNNNRLIDRISSEPKIHIAQTKSASDVKQNNNINDTWSKYNDKIKPFFDSIKDDSNNANISFKKISQHDPKQEEMYFNKKSKYNDPQVKSFDNIYKYRDPIVNPIEKKLSKYDDRMIKTSDKISKYDDPLVKPSDKLSKYDDLINRSYDKTNIYEYNDKISKYDDPLVKPRIGGISFNKTSDFDQPSIGSISYNNTFQPDRPDQSDQRTDQPDQQDPTDQSMFRFRQNIGSISYENEPMTQYLHRYPFNDFSPSNTSPNDESIFNTLSQSQIDQRNISYSFENQYEPLTLKTKRRYQNPVNNVQNIKNVKRSNNNYKSLNQVNMRKNIT